MKTKVIGSSNTIDGLARVINAFFASNFWHAEEREDGSIRVWNTVKGKALGDYNMPNYGARKKNGRYQFTVREESE